MFIVEDENLIAGTIVRHLERLGYRVAGQCDNAQDAISLIPQDPPDVVLMDIRIEGDMDGVQAAERIRELYGLPVVFLTALMDEDTLERAKITQPFGYIVKPFSRRELHVGLEIAYHNSQMERRLAQRELMIESVVTNAERPLCIINTDFEVQFANRAFCLILDWEGEASDHHLPPQLREPIEDVVSLSPGSSGERIVVPCHLPGCDHRVNFLALRDRRGRLVGFSIRLDGPRP